MGLVINFTIDEKLLVEGELSAQSVLDLVIEDDFLFLLSTMLDGESYIVLSLDTDRLFPTMHSYPFFNSFTEINGELFATTIEGVYKLSGDTDDGEAIHTGIIWDKTSFGIQNKKRLRTAIVDGNINDITMKATTSSGSAISTLNRNRLPVRRSLYGRDWEIRLADFDRLETFELIPVVLRR